MKKLIEPFLLLFRDWNLTRELFRRTLVQRYVGTKFGWWWLAVNPLLLIGVYVFMFTVIFPIRRPGETPLQHALSIAQCLMMYYIFADSTGAATSALVRQPSLVKRQTIPLALLPVLELYPSLVQFIPCTALLVMLGLLFGSGVQPTYPALILLLPPAILLAAGVSWILASCAVYFRDLEAMYSHLSRIFLYTSGVFWGVAQLPDSIRIYFEALPLMQISELTRQYAFRGELGNWGGLAYLYASSFVIFFIGYFVFQQLRAGFADHL